MSAAFRRSSLVFGAFSRRVRSGFSAIAQPHKPAGKKGPDCACTIGGLRLMSRPRSGRCRSSGVEHSLGKGEVESSNLSGSTICYDTNIIRQKRSSVRRQTIQTVAHSSLQGWSTCCSGGFRSFRAALTEAFARKRPAFSTSSVVARIPFRKKSRIGMVSFVNTSMSSPIRFPASSQPATMAIAALGEGEMIPSISES